MSNESKNDMTPEEFVEFKSDFRHQGEKLDKLTTLVEKLVDGQNQTLIEVPLIKQTLESIGKNQAEFNTRLVEVESRQSNHGRVLQSHATTWKIVSGACVLLIGLGGWAWQQLDTTRTTVTTLEKTLNSSIRSAENSATTQISSMDRRLSLLEYQIGNSTSRYSKSEDSN